jgi:hypothetical protein
MIWSCSCLIQLMKTNIRSYNPKREIPRTAAQDWCRLAEQVATETDPQRLMDLLDQLIHALDARRGELRSQHLEPPPVADMGESDG